MWLDCCDISHCFHVIKRWLEIYFCLIFPFFSNYIPYGYKSSGRAQQRRLANLCFLLRFHCSSSPQLRYLGSNKILNLFLSAAIFSICNIWNIWNIFNWQYFQFAIFAMFERSETSSISRLPFGSHPFLPHSKSGNFYLVSLQRSLAKTKNWVSDFVPPLQWANLCM